MKYSITIPAYKSTFFRECLESVLAQSFEDYEVVILNDCSPENIKGIVEEFRSHKNWSKVRYYENDKNVGAIDVVDNWNKLLSLAQGEFIICMGDDDKLSPECLKVYNDFVNKYHDKDVFHIRTKIIDEKSATISLQPFRNEEESAYEMLWHGICGSRVQFIGDFLFRISTLRRLGGFYYMPLAFISDWITCMIVAKDRGIININDVLFYYRSSTITITSTGNRRLMVDAWWRYKDWILDFLKDIPENETDKRYRLAVLGALEDKRRESILDNIAYDIVQKPFGNTIFWWRHRRVYGLSCINILYASAIALYRKIKHSVQ